MFNRKIEGPPRSERFFRIAVYPALHLENNTFYPAVDAESLDLAYLFAEEERLGTEIGNDKLSIEKNTIYRAVALARKIAQAGYPLQLVSTDEMLDIAQIFSVADSAASTLVDLLAKLDDSNNSAWTARVAVGLAYFSALENQNTSRSNPEVRICSSCYTGR